MQPARLLCPWDSLGKYTLMGCHFLLERIFPTQELNPGFLPCRQILYSVSHKGSPQIPLGQANNAKCDIGYGYKHILHIVQNDIFHLHKILMYSLQFLLKIYAFASFHLLLANFLSIKFYSHSLKGQVPLKLS